MDQQPQINKDNGVNFIAELKQTLDIQEEFQLIPKIQRNLIEQIQLEDKYISIISKLFDLSNPISEESK